MKAARQIGVYQGKRVYRFPVVILFNNSSLCRTVARLEFDVISTSVKEAANWARDQVANRPETEIIAYGPKGGETRRYVGWESAIGHELMSSRGTDLSLFN